MQMDEILKSYQDFTYLLLEFNPDEKQDYFSQIDRVIAEDGWLNVFYQKIYLY
jgi:hypothetical protein